MNVELVPIDSITPYARNPRRNEAAVDKVAASIHEFGWRVPIVVDEANVIVCGHTRHQAARKLGLEYIAVHRAVGLTPAQIKAYRLMDNRSHQDSSWDEELLGLELEDLKGLDYDLSLTGFDLEELADFGPIEESHPDISSDFIPEPPAEPVTRLGDVWRLGAHRIVCGDVRREDTWLNFGLSEMLRTGKLQRPAIQMCVTSPPYWGLRDYGTAQWKGGEAGCEHVSGNARNDADNTFRPGRTEPGKIQYRDTCPKCGARRIDAQLGLEATPEKWTANLVEVFRRVRECLVDDGTLWVNVGDSYSGGGGYSPDAPSNRDGNDRNGGRSREFSSDKRRPTPGLKPKDLVGQPWRLAFALQSDGWWLRQDIIWAKPNPMPESCEDRCTKSHEYLFLLSKSARYYFDNEAIKEPASVNKPWADSSNGGGKAEYIRADGGILGRPADEAGRNRRSVWQVATQPFTTRGLFDDMHRIVSPDCPIHGVPARTRGSKTAGVPGANGGGLNPSERTHDHTACRCTYSSSIDHFAVYPCKLIEPCILAGSPKDGLILDCFLGAGTTMIVAEQTGRACRGIELNPAYIDIAIRRFEKLFGVQATLEGDGRTFDAVAGERVKVAA